MALATVVAIAAALPILWAAYAAHHSFCHGAVCVRYEEGVGEAGEVRFHVESPSGKPLGGLKVNTMSNARFGASEWEVIAVQVDGRVVQFWPSPVDLVAGPDTGTGVWFNVVLR